MIISFCFNYVKILKRKPEEIFFYTIKYSSMFIHLYKDFA